MSDTERDFFRWKETYSCIESETLNFFLLLSRSLSIEAAACLGKLWPQFEEKESSHAASLEKEREILEEASVPYFSSSSSAEIFSQGNCSY